MTLQSLIGSKSVAGKPSTSRPSQGFLVTGVFREFTDASHEGIADRWEPPGLDVGGVC